MLHTFIQSPQVSQTRSVIHPLGTEHRSRGILLIERCLQRHKGPEKSIRYLLTSKIRTSFRGPMGRPAGPNIVSQTALPNTYVVHIVNESC